MVSACVTDRVVSKLGLSKSSQITVSASSPEALAVAGAAALKTNALLHVGSAPAPASAVVIDDASLAQ